MQVSSWSPTPYWIWKSELSEIIKSISKWPCLPKIPYKSDSTVIFKIASERLVGCWASKNCAHTFRGGTLARFLIQTSWMTNPPKNISIVLVIHTFLHDVSEFKIMLANLLGYYRINLDASARYERITNPMLTNPANDILCRISPIQLHIVQIFSVVWEAAKVHPRGLIQFMGEQLHCTAGPYIKPLKPTLLLLWEF